jgi:hypothetical protein
MERGNYSEVHGVGESVVKFTRFRASRRADMVFE